MLLLLLYETWLEVEVVTTGEEFILISDRRLRSLGEGLVALPEEDSETSAEPDSPAPRHHLGSSANVD